MKAWKWTRRFGCDVDVREGEVHQHRLAAPDAAPQIDSGRALPAGSEQARQESGPLPPVAGEPVERRHRPRLCRVGLELVGGNQLVICSPNRANHRADGPLGLFTRLRVPVKL